LIASTLDLIGRHATKFLGVGVLLGFAVPPLASLARPLLVPALLIPLTIALVRLDWSAMGAYARRPLFVAAVIVWLLVVSPVAMWAVLAPVPMPESLYHALVLMAAASPIISSAAIALLLGLDAALAVVVIVVSTALLPFTLPVLALKLLGLELQIDLATFMLRLGAMVGGAFAAALLVRRLVPKHRIAQNARTLDALSVINLVIFAVAIMDGVTAFAAERPAYVALATAAAFAANLALQAVGTLAWSRLGMRRALTLGLMTGNCNMGLVMVALGRDASFEVIVFFAMAQLPMYMLPGLLTPLYRKLAARDPA
jgi:BASS family bile acid:Na+ symporter